MSPDEARRLLELSPEGSEQDLHSAYRAMLLVWHPDRFAEGSELRQVATARTRRVIEAFRLLRDRGVGASEPEPPPLLPAAGLDTHAPARSPLRFTAPTPEKTRQRAEAPGGSTRRLVGAVAVAAVTAAVGVGVTLFGGGLREAPAQNAQVLQTGVSHGAAATAVPEKATVVARYSMAIGSFRDVNRARALVRMVEQGAPEVWTTIVPVEVRGAVFHRVLAGMSEDLSSLDETVAVLSAALGQDSSGWMPREAGLTLCLSESVSLEDVRPIRDRATRLGIETFVLRVAVGGADAALRLCAGSYEGSSEAAYLQRMLVEAGFEPVPRARSGEPVAPAADAT